MASQLFKLHITIATLLVIMISLQTAPVKACSCAPSHPQASFCSQDWAIKAKVKSARLLRMKDGFVEAKVYGVKISKVFKLGANNFTNGLFVKLYTASSDSLCGVELTVNTIYYLEGSTNSENRPVLNICGHSMPWYSLPPIMKMGYAYLYQKSCNCSIIGFDAKSDCCLERDWNSKKIKCYNEHSACVTDFKPTNTNALFPAASTSNSCKWSKRRVLKLCLKSAGKPEDKPYDWEP